MGTRPLQTNLTNWLIMKAELAVTDLARKILPDLLGSKRRHDSRIAAGAFGLRKRGTTGRLCAWQVKDIAAPAWVNAYGNQSDECAEIDHSGDEMPGSF